MIAVKMAMAMPADQQSAIQAPNEANMSHALLTDLPYGSPMSYRD
jgi:hypothetical protein